MEDQSCLKMEAKASTVLAKKSANLIQLGTQLQQWGLLGLLSINLANVVSEERRSGLKRSRSKIALRKNEYRDVILRAVVGDSPGMADMGDIILSQRATYRL